MKSKNPVVNVYSKSDEGHRKSYFDFLSNFFWANRVGLVEGLWGRPPLLFLMVEEAFVFYFSFAVIRSIFGKKTVGLLFRPLPAIEAKSWRLKIKRILLKFLKRIDSVSTLTILPHSVFPSLATVSDDGIYDFQLWDLLYISQQENTGEFPNWYHAFLDVNRKKHTIFALGRQDEQKGFCYLPGFLKFTNYEYDLISLGKINSELKDVVNEVLNAGAVLENRFVSDRELSLAYSLANKVWCCYTPSYDQASGILGRAVQLGVVPILREGSLMSIFCQKENIPCTLVNIVNGNVVGVFDSINPTPFPENFREMKIRNMRDVSLTKLKNALGV